jgi:DNA-binding ferritin-like protein (Dps family)
MAPKWIEVVTGPLEQKKQYRDAMKRLKALPEPYAGVGAAVHRYHLYCAGVVDGETSVQMTVDLVDLFDRAAADGTPVRDIVSDDPVAFAEQFAQAYNGRTWIDRERARLVAAVDSTEQTPS